MTENIKSYHIYTLVDCPACKRAVKLLTEKKEVFAVTVLDNDQEKLNNLKEEYCWQTVPMIVGKTEENKELFLGGCSDLERRFGVSE
jgi:glutaredoxin